jgi:hypothetical protein
MLAQRSLRSQPAAVVLSDGDRAEEQPPRIDLSADQVQLIVGRRRRGGQSECQLQVRPRYADVDSPLEPACDCLLCRPRSSRRR